MRACGAVALASFEQADCLPVSVIWCRYDLVFVGLRRGLLWKRDDRHDMVDASGILAKTSTRELTPSMSSHLEKLIKISTITSVVDFAARKTITQQTD